MYFRSEKCKELDTKIYNFAFFESTLKYGASVHHLLVNEMLGKK